MSSSSVRPQVSVFLAELLAAEKDDTRSWLRDEIDRLVDPMLYSIFQRLTHKLVANTNLDRSGDHRAQVNQLNHVESANSHVHHSATFIVKPSNSIISNSFNAHCNHQAHSIGYEPEFDPEILAQVKREIKEEENEMTLMDNAAQTNQFDTRPSATDNHHLFHETDSTFEDVQFMNQPILDDHQPNRQVNNFTDIQKLAGETNNAQIVHIEEGEDTEIEDNEESRTGEKAQIETTLPHPNGQTQQIARQSARRLKRKQTDEDTEGDDDGDEEEGTSRSIKQPRSSRPTTPSSTIETQVISLTFRCPQGCDLMFAKEELNQHLKEVHSSGQFLCAVKDCGQAFDNRMKLRQHLTQSHQSTSQWNCHKCDKRFISYQRLSTHNNQHHHLGHFRCSFPACTFTGEYKKKVYDHYTQQHRKTSKCTHSSCPYETANAAHYRQHLRAHLGIKPYKCTQCDFAATERSSTIGHIRRMHFKGKPSSSVQLDDYVEVNEMLLDNLDGHDDGGGNVNSTKQNTQIITVTLKCAQCGLMFDKDELNKHLKVKHSIGQFRCLLKDCGQAFNSSAYLRRHLAQSHQSTSQWHCGKCDRHFTSYDALTTHNTKYHQLGHFQCSFPSCTFTRDNKRKVYDHYTAQHKQRSLKKCPLPGCHFRTAVASNLKRHHQAHLGIRPYKCKWSHCDYASIERYKTIAHIRRMHFKGKPSSSVRLDEYVEVSDTLVGQANLKHI